MNIKSIFIFYCLLTTCVLSSQELQPTDKLALLKGIVTDFQGTPLAGEIIMFSDEKTGKIIRVNTGAKGTFSALVPAGATYDLRYKNFTLDMDYTRMTIPPDKNAIYEVEVKIQPPKEFVLNNVYFETGKSSLRPASGKALNELAEVLKLKKSMVIEVQGHTDNTGSAETNMTLSQARAEAVRTYLLSKGIKAARVRAKGYGPTRPVADNATETGRAKNRRTSLKVISD